MPATHPPINAETLAHRTGIHHWPRISIVTVSYNMVDYLEATLRSVLSQAYPNLEYIVVDGGSTDGSVEIIERYADHLAWWVSEPDDGMYDALQKGFERATGDIMAWLNADDMYHPGALFMAARIFARFPNVRWIQGRPTVFDRSGNVVHIAPLKVWSKYEIYRGSYEWIQQESTFWRRSLWKDAGGYVDRDLSYAGDFELWLRFFRHAALHPANVLLGGFRFRGPEQASQGHREEYHDEVRAAIAAERDRLTEAERSVIRRLDRIHTLSTWIRRAKVLNTSGFQNFLGQRDLLDYPEAIRFEPSTQSLVTDAPSSVCTF